jgi:hypothetical protein
MREKLDDHRRRQLAHLRASGLTVAEMANLLNVPAHRISCA